MNMTGTAFLSDNYFKILDLRKAQLDIGAEFTDWIHPIAKGFFQKNGQFNSKIEKKTSKTNDESSIYFFSRGQFKGKRFPYEHLDLGVGFDSDYSNYNREYFGHYAFAEIKLKPNKYDINSFKKFVTSKITKKIKGDFKLEDAIDTDGLLLCLTYGDDFDNGIIKRQTTLKSLATDIKKLGTELLKISNQFIKEN